MLKPNLQAENSDHQAVVTKIEQGFLSLLLRNLKPASGFGLVKLSLARHQLIWQAIRLLSEQQTKIDELLVAEKLHQSGKLKAAGGLIYLSQLYEFAPLGANINNYWRLLKSYELQAEFKRFLLEQVKYSANSGKFNSQKILATVTELLNRLIALAGQAESLSLNLGPQIDEYLSRAAADLTLSPQERLRQRFVKTGFKSLDDEIDGLPRGKLTVIGARPGVGKTTLALNMVINNLLQGEAALFISLEQSREQLITKLISILAGVDNRQLQKLNLLPKQWQTVKEQATRLKSTKLKIIDDPLELKELLAVVRRAKLQNPALGLVVLDYLGLLEINHGNHRVEQINHAVLKLKQLAKELQICLVLISGLKKQAPRYGEPSLEQCEYISAHHGDFYLLLWIEQTFWPEQEKLLYYSVAKNKEGQLTNGKLSFNQSTQQIADCEP